MSKSKHLIKPNTKILKNIENGVFRILPKKHGRSKIWNVFNQIEKDDGTVMKGVVICKICNKILKFDGKQSCNLVRHSCYVMQIRNATVKKERSEEFVGTVYGEILQNIDNGIYRVLQNTESRSKVWNVFNQIEKDDGTIIEGYVICRVCRNIYNYNGKQTSNLIRHKCYFTQMRNLALKQKRSKFVNKKNTDILKNIENGTFRILHKTQCKSTVWTVFSQIEKNDGTLIDGVVICQTCNTILKYNGKQTSNLVRHFCYVMQIRNGPLKQVSSEEKENLLVACTQWVVQDCRPFSIVDGEGFKKLVQSLLNIGTKYGNNINISDMVPDSRTISRRIGSIAEEKRLQIREELEMAIESGTASITTDLWSDNIIKRNFLCVTFHFIKDLKLKEIVLGVKSMDFQRCTAENIISKLKSILKDFKVNSMENITFVTNSESEIVKALNNQYRINCASHLLNNVLDSSLRRTKELMLLFESCKKLVKYYKKTSLQDISSTLEGNCTARWNSHLKLFKSILNKYFEIQEFLSSKGETHRTSDIDLSVLNALVEIFEKFNIVSDKLQDLKDVTINYVYLTINTIKNICEERLFDAEIIKALKRNILKEMETKYIANLNIIHYTACFLYPPTNSCLDERSLKEVKGFCVSEIIKSVQLSENPANSTTFDESPQDFKLFFSNLVPSGNPSVSESISDEINRYSYAKVNADVNFDVLQWWENHSSEYPRLYKFAQKILAIPASNAASERVIYATGNIITEKRNRVGPQTINNLLFLNSIDKYE